jgi:hypothetical protein
MTTKIVRGTRCGKPCPERLSGHLGTVTCSLETDANGHHSGDHRGRASIKYVGKAVLSWKNADKGTRTKETGTLVVYSGGPPVVDLRDDAALNPYLTGAMRKDIPCECPDWWIERGSKMHHSPCRLL